VNASRAGLEGRIAIRRGSLLDPVLGTADVIVANLPYLPLSERRRYPELASEPPSALFAEGDGFGLVRRLAPDGLLALQVRGRIHAARRPDLRVLEHLLAPQPVTAAA
jgi:methylase of polypeptide subunit release factors